jgi:hypothetical protein
VLPLQSSPIFSFIFGRNENTNIVDEILKYIKKIAVVSKLLGATYQKSEAKGCQLAKLSTMVLAGPLFRHIV